MKRLMIAAALALLALAGCTSDAELGDGEVTDRGALSDTSKRAGGPMPKVDVDGLWDSHSVGIPAWLLPEVD